MIELKEHAVYSMLNTAYDEVALDYVILHSEEEYAGAETHKRAVIKAFDIIRTRMTAEDGCACKMNIEPEKMQSALCSIDQLLQLPEDDYYSSRPAGSRCYAIPYPMPYWYAFLEPPYGTSYLTSDFLHFNNVLFPNREDTEVYRWNDDFSDYFDAGKEWRGTGLWSAYDKNTGIFVIIGASETD